MKSIDKFIGLYPVSKTLRFELRPVGKTKDRMDEMGYLITDEEKADEPGRGDVIGKGAKEPADALAGEQ